MKPLFVGNVKGVVLKKGKKGRKTAGFRGKTIW